MIERVFVSGVVQMFDQHAVSKALKRATERMDYVISVEELPRTGDARKFIVIGTPRY